MFDFNEDEKTISEQNHTKLVTGLLKEIASIFDKKEKNKKNKKLLPHKTSNKENFLELIFKRAKGRHQKTTVKARLQKAFTIVKSSVRPTTAFERETNTPNQSSATVKDFETTTIEETLESDVNNHSISSSTTTTKNTESNNTVMKTEMVTTVNDNLKNLSKFHAILTEKQKTEQTVTEGQIMVYSKDQITTQNDMETKNALIDVNASDEIYKQYGTPKKISKIVTSTMITMNGTEEYKKFKISSMSTVKKNMIRNISEKQITVLNKSKNEKQNNSDVHSTMISATNDSVITTDQLIKSQNINGTLKSINSDYKTTMTDQSDDKLNLLKLKNLTTRKNVKPQMAKQMIADLTEIERLVNFTEMGEYLLNTKESIMKKGKNENKNLVQSSEINAAVIKSDINGNIKNYNFLIVIKFYYKNNVIKLIVCFFFLIILLKSFNNK